MSGLSAAPVSLAKLHEDSNHTVCSNFYLFKVVPTETLHAGHSIISYQLLNDPVIISQIQIYVLPSADAHTVLQNRYLLVEYKITKCNGTNLPAYDSDDMHVYPKGLAHSLFESP